MGAARKMWDAAKHPRGPNGRFIKAGGGGGESGAANSGLAGKVLGTLSRPSPTPRGTAAARFSAKATPPVRAKTPAPSVSVDDRVRAAYGELARERDGWVGLRELRQHPELRDLPRDQQDAALKALSRAQVANIVPESKQTHLTQADRDAALLIGGEHKHAISIPGHGGASKTAATPASAPAPEARSLNAPATSPSRMTKGQYTRLLKDEHIRLSMLGGKSEKEAKAAARPAATIDDLKARNAELRNQLRLQGVDYRTDEQRRTDDVEKTTLLDEVERLATAGGHDGAGKRAAAARMTVPELRKFVTDVRQFQKRQAEKKEAARAGAAAQAAFDRRQATLPATGRQIDYILTLLTRRARSGEGGGFFTGPTDRAGIAKLSQADASAYINSLTGNY